MQYQLQANSFGEVVAVTIVGTRMSIPFDPANMDYQDYLRWVDNGNVPLPADENESTLDE